MRSSAKLAYSCTPTKYKYSKGNLVSKRLDEQVNHGSTQIKNKEELIVGTTYIIHYLGGTKYFLLLSKPYTTKENDHAWIIDVEVSGINGIFQTYIYLQDLGICKSFQDQKWQPHTWIEKAI